MNKCDNYTNTRHQTPGITQNKNHRKNVNEHPSKIFQIGYKAKKRDKDKKAIEVQKPAKGLVSCFNTKRTLQFCASTYPQNKSCLITESNVYR